jgi:hypothetical protein
MKKYFKNLFLLLTVLITTNILAYQATTNEGKKIQQFAENLKKFSKDYKPYLRVDYPYFSHSGYDDNQYNYFKHCLVKDYSYGGRVGTGAYSAKGNELLFAHGKPTTLIISKGIKGEPLLGYVLAELFDIAAALDDFKNKYSNSVAKVFPEKVTDPKITKFKQYIVDLKFSLIRYPGDQGIVSILKNIEPNGKDGVYLNKDYSVAAVTRDQVMAINNLNALLNNFHEMLATEEEIDAFFNYVAAFVDQGGPSDEFTIITTYEDLQHVLATYKNEVQPNISKYQAVTDAGKNVEQYANNLQKFLTDYTIGYNTVKQDRDNGQYKYPLTLSHPAKSSSIVKGKQGQGTYAAIGGEEFTISYKTLQLYKHRYLDTIIKQHEATIYGITGQDLYGARLTELYELAELLEENRNNVAQVFGNIENTPTVTEIKDNLIDFKFKYGNSKAGSLTDILNIIEPNGKYEVLPYKNYSEEAINEQQVKAINYLNGALESLSEQLKKDKDSLLFQYIAAFVDNGGTADANAIIEDNQNLALPKFHLYQPLPSKDEFMQALVVGNNQIFELPRELTRITNDYELRRILGKPYREHYTRTEDLKKMYKQAKKNYNKKVLEKYNLEI